MDWDRVKEIVAEALALPRAERKAYVEDACGKDEELLREVRALLNVSTTEADVYEDVRLGPQEVSQLTPGDEIGRYRILRQIATSRMSTVYLAEDTDHSRKVALKVVPPHAAALTASETQILAQLQHPNIATLLDSGTIDGQTYFVMEYVDGVSLTEFAAPLSLRERLKLFIEVCGAVQYAHGKLIVHRDLKPQNILVSGDGTPKLLDFGIAKIIPQDEELTATALGDRPMTVAFASPEQLAGAPTALATDIYSLGVLLSLLVSGRLPYQVEHAHELPWAIRHLEPTPPSALADSARPPASAVTCHPPQDPRLVRLLRGDLDAITLKALRKEEDLRYGTVAELANDVRRFLAHEPVRARRGSRLYSARKFCRRHLTPLVSAVAVVLALVAAAVWSVWKADEAARERDHARTEAERSAAIAGFLNDIFTTIDPREYNSQRLEPKELIRRALMQLDPSRLPGEDAIAVLLTAGRLYRSLGDYDASADVLDDALGRAGEHSSTRLLALVEQARTLLMRDQAADALSVAQTALHATESLSKVPPETSLEIQHMLANIHHKDGRFEEAHAAYEAALALATAHFGEVHRKIALIVNDQAVLAVEQDDYANARRLYERALKLRRALFGDDHTWVAETLNGLGVLHYQQGDYAKAEPLFREALATRRAILGDEHPATLSSLTNLGGVLNSAGRYQDSEPFLSQALETLSKVYGADNFKTFSARYNLAALFSKLDRLDESIELFRQSVDLGRTRFGDAGHPSLASALNYLGSVLSGTRQLDAAEEALIEALAIRRRLLPSTHTGIAVTLSNLGRVASQRGEFQKAEDFHREALALFAGLGAGHAYSVRTTINLIGVLKKSGQVDEALRFCTSAKTAACETLGESHDLTGRLLSKEGELLLMKGELPEAERRAADGLEILRKALPSSHPDIDVATAILARIETAQGNFESAEQRLLERAQQEGYLDAQPHSEQRRSVLEALVELNGAMGRPAKAAEYREVLDQVGQ